MSGDSSYNDDPDFIQILLTLPNFPEAFCKGSKDAAMWDFSIPDETIKQARIRRYRASAICRKKCAHAEACRAWATEHEENGVWGGEIFPTPHAAFLKCTSCRKPMLKRKTKRRMPYGHVPAHTTTICVHCKKTS